MSRTTADRPPACVHVFEGATANDVWRAALALFGDSGPAQAQASRNGPTRELLHTMFSISNPRQRWIPARRPAVNPAFAIAEALWMLWGRNDEALPAFFNQQYSTFNGAGPTYYGAYGYRLRAAFGIDQLQRAADALSGTTDSRQVILQIWSATEDLPNTDGSPRRADIPCNIVSMLKLRNNQLHWTQVLRSNDLILGVPYNIVQFTTLQEVLAGWLEAEVGPYTQLSDSLHMYDRDLGQSGTSDDGNAEPNNDNLSLKRTQSIAVLSALERTVNLLIQPNLSEAAFRGAVDLSAFPVGYGNLLAIIGAEAARRRRWLPIANTLADRCTNPALRQIWTAWLTRLGKGHLGDET